MCTVVNGLTHAKHKYCIDTQIDRAIIYAVIFLHFFKSLYEKSKRL